MIDPGFALLGTCAVILLGSIALWPERGLVWQLRRAKKDMQRVLIEDALKHLYHHEYKGQAATLESMSGALGIKRDQTANLLARLEAREMIKTQHDGFGLTSEGRAYALRIIRVHRLWERYLADETGLSATEWHHEAEEREHDTSPEEAEALASLMGNPPHDPHGDPIPSPTGELPPRRGVPLTDLPVDELARISHIEDEPEMLFAQLVAQGLFPGMQIRILEKSPQRIRCLFNGEEVVLAPVVASNVTVVPVPKEQEVEGPHEPLSTIGVGESGVVVGISNACRGMQRRRLMDLGVVPGAVISAELKSASGNPVAYNVRGALIALRREQASQIYVSRKEAA